MAVVFLGLGSNLGDRRANLRAAVAGLGSMGVSLKRPSSLYETDPVDFIDQPPFLNAVIEVETDFTPPDLLKAIQRVEVAVGRKPRFRYGPREIDIDILLFDDLRLVSPELTIPHARLSERAFVQMPLRELMTGQRDADGKDGVAWQEGPEWASGISWDSP